MKINKLNKDTVLKRTVSNVLLNINHSLEAVKSRFLSASCSKLVPKKVMNCIKCNSSNSIKKGLRNHKQRFYCKDCKKSFQFKYTYQAYKSTTNHLIKSLLKEGCGVRSIGRILNISNKTVLSRLLKISK